MDTDSNFGGAVSALLAHLRKWRTEIPFGVIGKKHVVFYAGNSDRRIYNRYFNRDDHGTGSKALC